LKDQIENRNEKKIDDVNYDLK